MRKRGGEKVYCRDISSPHSQCPMHRKAIALLVTLFFIIAITVSVGISLTQLQKGSLQLQEGRFLTQSSAVMEDVLTLLQNSSEIFKIEDAVSFNIFLMSASLIPFEAGDLRVKIAMRSARDKLNINTLAGSEELQESLKKYLMRYNIQDISYLVDILLDCMGGKQDIYRTEIFDEIPWMYRDRIVNYVHLQQLLDFYVKMRHDNSVHLVPWQEIMSFDRKNTEIDANYARAEVWRLMLPDTDEGTIQMLVEGGLTEYGSEADLGLSAEELQQLTPFGLAYYLPIIYVDVMIEENDKKARIVIKYDIASKKAQEFNYDI